MATCKSQKDCGMSQTVSFKNSISHQMQNIDEYLNCQDTIPATATTIKITTIKNPHLMRAYEIKNYSDALDRIVRKLWSFIKTDEFLKRKNDTIDPKIGDMVLIVSKNNETEVELPSFICRGLITHLKKESSMYYVLLVDHGITIELTRRKFCVVSQNFISEKYLTKIVGVYNILSIRMRKNVSNSFNSYSSTAIVVEEWSEEAIEFAKDLFFASKVVYFDHLFTDEMNGREYGEFYLIIDDRAMPLSKALVINYYAIYLERDLLQLIESSNHTLPLENEYIIHAKFSNNEEHKDNAIQVHNRINDALKKFCLSEKIFLQSTIICGVLTDVNDLSYPKGIHEGWNIYIKSSRPLKLQSYMWPAINKRLNVVAIGPSQCGKTSGCVMALCGRLAMCPNELSRNATQPSALFLCSSSFEVINVHSMCTSLLYDFRNIKSVAAFTGKTDRSIAATIYSGCQILITTPRYLVRFLNENKSLLSFDRLSCLIFDNADVILDKYYMSVGELFKKYNIIQNREPQGDNRPILQIIMSARNWTPQIKKFVSLAMYSPYICIASFIEAIVYKSIKLKLHILKSTHKNEQISVILKDEYMTLRTMIICVNAKEAEELNIFLLPTKKTLLIHENMKLSEIYALQENWKACVCGLYPVVICTDVVLSELNITNIQWLIHHSVLSKTKNKFNYRFSVLLDDLIQVTTNCKVNIIIDENNNVQFRSIITMMQRMKLVLSLEMLENVERITATLERDKKDYVICDNVKLFGFCQEQNTCVFRHCVLPEIDMPMTNIQINDKVKLKVMYIHDTTHFSARIIEHIPHSNKSEKIIFSNVEYMQIALKMQNYYNNIENRKVCTSTNVGDICVLEESIDMFKRIQIRRIRYDKDSSENVKFVDVRCIDSGIIHESIDVRKLLHIPEELLNLPTHIVEIYLAGLAPYDEEYIWNYYSIEPVHKWFTEHLDGRSYIIGKVCFHLGNTIWLNDLEVGTKLIGHPELIGFSLKKELITGNCAISNDDHIPKLFKLCNNSGLTEINGYDINTV